MELVISDTNIFIDVISLGMADVLFQLPYKIVTLDLVLGEIEEEWQMEVMERAVKSGALGVKVMSGHEMAEAMEFKRTFRGNVSLVDVSIIRYAIATGADVFTGDRSMRTQAEERGVTVRGILFIFDEFVSRGLVPPSIAAAKLEELVGRNKRLPRGECLRRIEAWSRQ